MRARRIVAAGELRMRIWTGMDFGVKSPHFAKSTDVRFTPKSGHYWAGAARPL